MAVPKTTETRCRDWQCTGKTGYKKTTQATPSLHLSFFSLHGTDVPRIVIAKTHRTISRKKKDVYRDGVACVVFL